MSHPSDDFKFGISTVVTEKEIDVDDRGAAIRVIVRFVKANPDTMWRLAEATLVLDLDKDKHLPETISIEGGETSGQFMRFRLDTDEMEHDGEVTVPLTVKTGVFAGADDSAKTGPYPIPALVELRYKRRAIDHVVVLGSVDLTVAED